MHRLKTLTGALALGLLTAGAASAAVSTGAADFKTYVAFGDSLTAGFSSGALSETYQRNSYPALIYRQVYGNDTNFAQPLVSAPGIGSGGGILGLRGLFPTLITPNPKRDQPINRPYPAAVNHIAVPGATLHDLVSKTQSTSASDITDLILRKFGATQ